MPEISTDPSKEIRHVILFTPLADGPNLKALRKDALLRILEGVPDSVWLMPNAHGNLTALEGTPEKDNYWMEKEASPFSYAGFIDFASEEWVPMQSLP